MPLRLTNTLSGKKEEFTPMTPGRVSMYVCGVTVYDMCHIGHARSGVVFDLIYRYLQFIGYQVEFVKNFTDVDDKIIRRANEEGVGASVISERYIAEYYTDMDALGLSRPTHEPRVTESANMQAILDMISRLIERGMAYASGGDVYYRVKKFQGYGKLSKKKTEELEIGARIEPGEHKEDALDFALWKAAKPGEPAWDSPWGKGRPGWHIECSAMSTRLLGSHFDIHGGGHDLIFPHHENEIAQAEGATGEIFANYWMHNGFVNINAEKMSKSLKNYVTIRDILGDHPAEVLRYFLVASHYHSPIDFTEKNLHDARRALERLYATLSRMKDYSRAAESDNADAGAAAALSETARRAAEGFRACMDDDFNTSGALGVIFESVTEINKFLDSHPRREAAGGAVVESLLALLVKLGWVLGILQQEPVAFFNELKSRGMKEAGLDEAGIQALIAERAAAKKAKDFKRADSIRDELLAKGIVLKDSATGTTWEAKS